jgi:hypothetical protein
MMQQVLSHYHLPALACAGLGLFMVIFIGAVVWVFRTGSGAFYSGLESLPLDEPFTLSQGVKNGRK